MLIITIVDENFNKETQEFTYDNEVTLEFEHSLVSVSKWESKHKVPFLSRTEKTTEQTHDYVKAMLLTPNVDDETLDRLSTKDYVTIKAYLESTESATTFHERRGKGGSGETITSELIYYWMVAFAIPFEAEYWHLNRLLSLIRICNVKQDPKQNKRSGAEIAEERRSINEARRKEMGTSG